MLCLDPTEHFYARNLVFATTKCIKKRIPLAIMISSSTRQVDQLYNLVKVLQFVVLLLFECYLFIEDVLLLRKKAVHSSSSVAAAV